MCLSRFCLVEDVRSMCGDDAEVDDLRLVPCPGVATGK